MPSGDGLDGSQVLAPGITRKRKGRRIAPAALSYCHDLIGYPNTTFGSQVASSGNCASTSRAMIWMTTKGATPL